MINNPPAFDLDSTNKAIGTAMADLMKLMFPIAGAPLDQEAGQRIMKSIIDGIAAGSQACAEVTRLRAAFAAQRDAHRPQPHANPAASGALCAACSLTGAIVSWPCEPWTAAERALTHSQA